MQDKLDLDRYVGTFSKFVFEKERLLSFGNKWSFDFLPSAQCTSKKLAQSGFYYDGDCTAKCIFCLKSLIWEASDNPWEEHVSHCKDCDFVKLAKFEKEQTMIEHIDLQKVALKKWLKDDYLRLIEKLDKQCDAIVSKLKGT